MARDSWTLKLQILKTELNGFTSMATEIHFPATNDF